MAKSKLPNSINEISKSGFIASATNSFISISSAAKFLLVSPDTLRNWEKQGKISALRTPGGARRYNLSQLQSIKNEIKPVKNLRLLSVSKASSLLQVSKDTIRIWDKKGILQSTRTKGGARRFSRSEIIKLQKELGVEKVLKSENSTQLVLTAKNKKVPIRLLKLSSGLVLITFIIIFFLVCVSYINSLKTNLYFETKDILGEKTSDLQGQIFEVAGALEELQSSVGSMQKEPEKEYIYIPQTDLKISGNIESDLSPKIDNNYNLGSLNSSFKDGYVTNLFTSSASVNSFKLGGVNFISGSVLPEVNTGSIGDYYLKKSDSDSGFYIKSASGWNSVSNLSSLQTSYELDNNLKTVDGKDIKITLSDTNTDSNLSLSMVGDNSFRVNDDGSFSDSTPFIIDKSGQIGIGTDSPLSKLHLVSETNITDSDILRLDSQVLGVNSTVFRVDFEGDIFTDGAIYASSTIITSGNADVAEEYNVLDHTEEGDLVAVGGKTEVIKSNSPYQKNLLGVISSEPGLRLKLNPNESFNPKPIALAGRVPVKVSTENGFIEKGDYLTSSSIPGIAMKATKPGQVIGKALESYPNYPNPSLAIGKILTFVNVSFADPTQVLANIVLDEEGNLVIPKIKTSQLKLDVEYVNLENNTASGNYNPLEIVSRMDELHLNYLNFQIENARNTRELKLLQSKIEDLESILTYLSTQKSETNSQQTFKPQESDPYTSDQEISDLDLELTPPEILLTTPAALPGTSGSATLTDLKVTEILSSEKLLTALNADISGILRVFGEAILGTTTIAGGLVVDGTTSISGSSINSISCSENSEQLGKPDNQNSGLSDTSDSSGSLSYSEFSENCGILYLQNSPLAHGLDIFNGLVTIDNSGSIKAQSIIVADFKVLANKITGEGIIKKDTKSTDIEARLVGKNSRILITPTTETDLVFAVTGKIEKVGFTVSAPKIVDEDIYFDWWMVNEEIDNEIK